MGLWLFFGLGSPWAVLSLEQGLTVVVIVFAEADIGSNRTTSAKQEERRLKSHLQGAREWKGATLFSMFCFCCRVKAFFCRLAFGPFS